MLLAIDIGNTNIHLGLWNGRSWQHQWRLHTTAEQTSDEFGVTLMALLREFDVENLVREVALCSVVPWLTKTFKRVSRQYLGVEAMQLTYQSNTGIQLGQDIPAEVGADRIANAVAAYHLFPGATIVVDMGTATKFEVVTGAGEFLGGVIAPGLRLSADALAGARRPVAQCAVRSPAKHNWAQYDPCRAIRSDFGLCLHDRRGCGAFAR